MKRISHVGIGTGGGIPVALHADIDVAAGQQANFTGFDMLAAMTAVQGVANLFGGTAATGRAIGVFTDCSPKGDTGTVETTGFVWVKAEALTDIAVGDYVTPDSAHPGKVKEATAAGFPVAAEQVAGIWQVWALDATNVKVLICINDRI